jgi:queuine tRNA-ribosyltransferase
VSLRRRGDAVTVVDNCALADWRNSFQMVSLLKLAKVTEEGVRFLSPHDGTPMYACLRLLLNGPD